MLSVSSELSMKQLLIVFCDCFMVEVSIQIDNVALNA